jgi:hypothetical protein
MKRWVGGGRSASFCAFVSLKRRVHVAHGRGARTKPTNIAKSTVPYNVQTLDSDHTKRIVKNTTIFSCRWQSVDGIKSHGERYFRDFIIINRNCP